MQPNKSRKINVTLNAAGLAPGAEAAAEELEVQIVNQTAKSATIAWITNRPTTAEIHYGTNRQQLNSVAQDVRSQNQTIEDDVHYVVLKDLKPNTQYFFKITPAGQTPTASHTLRRFTTGPDTAPGSPQVICAGTVAGDRYR